MSDVGSSNDVLHPALGIMTGNRKWCRTVLDHKELKWINSEVSLLYSIESGNITVSTHYHRIYQEQQKFVLFMVALLTALLRVSWEAAVVKIQQGRVCVCMCISCCPELHKKCHIEQFILLFFFILISSNQQLLCCWMLVQEDRCCRPKACSHPVHHDMFDQRVASTAILEGGCQYWVEVATRIVKCYNEKALTELHWSVKIHGEVHRRTNKVAINTIYKWVASRKLGTFLLIIMFREACVSIQLQRVCDHQWRCIVYLVHDQLQDDLEVSSLSPTQVNHCYRFELQSTEHRNHGLNSGKWYG